jgi:tRNA modification GTPase
MTFARETRCCVLTPVGRGAVAVVAVEGPRATDLVDLFFLAANKKQLGEQRIGQILFGRWHGEAGEELIVCRLAEDRVEVHCHGGLIASTAIVDALKAQGCVVQQVNDWIEQHEEDPIAAEARIALKAARTERTAAILLDQYRGALRREITEIARLIDSREEQNRRQAAQKVARLLDRTSLGKHLTVPWMVAIAGPPNVGKSSLINALVGYDRAIVFNEPGTTRDIVTAQTAFDGWPVQLADTAGLRLAQDPLEAAGVEKAEELLAAADLILLVFDGTRQRSEEDLALAARFPNALTVYNKMDLVAASDRHALPDQLWTSAIERIGLNELQSAIVARLVPNPPDREEAVPFTPAQIETLRALKAKLAGS